MNNNIIEKVTQELLQYVEKENFKGYDPYDLLNSPFPFRYFGHMAQAIVVQAGKLLPFNPRPLLSVKKDIVPKGLGLFLSAYCKLYTVTMNQHYLDIAHYLFKMIVECRSKEYDEYCWGCNFVWANPHAVLPKYKPSSVVTSFVCQGIYDYYKLTDNEDAAHIIHSASQYILNHLNVTRTDDGICLSYTDSEKDCCYNASLLSGEILSMEYAISHDEKLLNLSKEIVSFVLCHQKEDGHWGYSIDLDTGKERKQIDFHQGFVLCSIYRICRNLNVFLPGVNEALRKGLRYYRQVQFIDKGRSLWRIPKEYPIDIHNQAQGIITFCELSEYNDKSVHFAKQIAEWTIKNMKSPCGYFYYRIFRYYTIRTPFIRWSQAWMLLAFSYLKSNMGISETTPPINIC